MPALLAMLSVRDYVLGAIIALLISGGVYEYHHLIDVGEARKLQQIKETSDKAEAAADAKVAAPTAQHANELTALKETYEKQHANDLAQSASDAERLREYDAYRSSHKVLPSAAGGKPNAAVPAAVYTDLDERITRLEVVSSELASSLRSTVDSLRECMTERDSLTGK